MMFYDDRRPCELTAKGKPAIKAFFHKWITEAYTIDPVLVSRTPGQIMFTKALVEYEDGTMHTVDPQKIRFTDNQ